MEINITANNQSEKLALSINGKLAAEIIIGEVMDFDDLKSEIEQARIAKTITRVVPDFIAGSKRYDSAKVAQGLADGLARKTQPHPTMGSGVPPVRPQFGRDYECGYDFGEWMSRVSERMKINEEIV